MMTRARIDPGSFESHYPSGFWSTLGLLLNPGGSENSARCDAWVGDAFRRNRLIVPEIADYEVRRELVRLTSLGGVARLDFFKSILEYLPVTTDAMLLAAQLWADIRAAGRPTTDRLALDSAVILAAQARTLDDRISAAIVATDNVGHPSGFVETHPWHQIDPVA